MSLFGPPNIEKMKAKGDINGLVKALDYQKDGTVRRSAAHALGEIGDTRGVEALVSVLKDQDPNVRKTALTALRKIGDARAIAALISIIKDTDPDARAAAAEALEKIRGQRSIEPLAAALQDTDPCVRQSATAALGKMDDSSVIEALTLIMSDANPKARAAAAEALEKIRMSLISVISKQRKDKRDELDKTTQSALRKLEKIGAPAVEPLIQVLGNAERNLRRAIVESLGNIKDGRVVDAVAAALKDSDEAVRLIALQALEKIGDQRAIPALVLRLERDLKMRQTVIQVLDRLNWQPSLDKSGAFYLVAKQKWEECIKIGAPALDALLEAHRGKDPSTRIHVLRVLGEIGDPGTVDPLIESLRDGDKDVRASAAEALGKIGDARGVEPLIKSLWDGDKDVRASAAEALGKIGDARGVEPLIAALRDRDQSVRKAVVEALRATSVPAIVPLIAALDHNDQYVREAAAALLAEMGAPAVEPLVNALKSRGSCQAIADLLDRLDWHPEQDESGAYYWIAKRNMDECVRIGTPALEPLASALRHENGQVRAAAADALARLGDGRAIPPLLSRLQEPGLASRSIAAQALVALYCSGKLDDQQKQLILAHRATITSKEHVDEPGTSHQDGGMKGRWAGSSWHEGCHEDKPGQSHSDSTYPGFDF